MLLLRLESVGSWTPGKNAGIWGDDWMVLLKLLMPSLLPLLMRVNLLLVRMNLLLVQLIRRWIKLLTRPESLRHQVRQHINHSWEKPIPYLCLYLRPNVPSWRPWCGEPVPSQCGVVLCSLWTLPLPLLRLVFLLLGTNILNSCPSIFARRWHPTRPVSSRGRHKCESSVAEEKRMSLATS